MEIYHCEKCENKQVILSKPKTFENYLVGNPRKFVSGLQERMNVTSLFCVEWQYLKHVGAFTHTHTCLVFNTCTSIQVIVLTLCHSQQVGVPVLFLSKDSSVTSADDSLSGRIWDSDEH